MDANDGAELEAVQAKILKTYLIGVPGTIALGLGIYGMVAARGRAFHPLLNDETVLYGLLIVGVAIEIWQLVTLFPLLKRRKELAGEL